MGLNFTSTAPSPTETSFITHHGKVPEPDCLSTFGALGAVASASTIHFDEPFPVTPATHPAGRLPGASSSKLTVLAMAGPWQSTAKQRAIAAADLSLIHISEPTRLLSI